MTSNLSRAEARQRSATLRITGYEVEVDVSGCTDPARATFPTRTRVRLTPSVEETFLDFIGDSVEAVDVDGVARGVEYDGARVVVRGLEPGREQAVTVRGHARYSRSGEGLHRYVDPADGRTYLYTQYEPSDARRVFANLEQPDLKAPFTFVVTAPTDWEVRTNQPEVSREDVGEVDGVACARRTYAPTPPVSTYLTCICAGPYSRWDDTWSRTLPDGTDLTVPLAMMCRASLADSFDPDALFTVTKQGLDFYHDAFDFPYPWGKYDSIFVPEYNLGAMENPGLVTFADAAFVYEAGATRSQHESRANVVLHEMAHMWFGDLVTPRWWDDLWLKESFADFMGSHVNAVATEFTDAWTPFAARRKAWAYLQDQLPSTHPIVADIPDVEAAKQNFDGITYAKGASVLKQLVAYVGQGAFFAGARTYFARHAYGATTLEDLLVALEEASGRDLRAWSAAWLRTSGVTTLTPELATTGATIDRLVVRQDGPDAHHLAEPTPGNTEPTPGNTEPTPRDAGAAPRDAGAASRSGAAAPGAGSGTDDGVAAARGDVDRPHRLVVGLYALRGTTLQRTHRLELDVAGPTTEVVEARGLPRPDLVLVNDDDLTYAKVRLDEMSLHTVTHHLTGIEESLSRACVWSALWNACRDGLLRAADYVSIVLRHAPTEEHDALLAGALGNAAGAIERYAPASERPDLRRRLLDTAWEQLHAASAGSGAQLTWARTVAGAAAVSDGRVGDVRALLDGDIVVDGLDLGHELRWQLWEALAATGHAEEADLDAERAADPTSLAPVRHLRALSSRPIPAVKAAVWSSLLDDLDASNDQVSARTAGFAHDTDGTLTRPYVGPYFEALERIWGSRSQEMAQRVVEGLFPGADAAELIDGQDVGEHPVAVAARVWLDAHPDAPRALRRIVVEHLDHVLRALAGQQAGRAPQPH